jgi:hypothetical protein
MAQSQHFSAVHVQHNGTYMLVIANCTAGTGNILKFEHLMP